MKITMDSAGRLVIPKPLRDAAGLSPGAELDIRYRDGRIEIDPSPSPVRFRRKGRIVLASRRGRVALTQDQVNRTLGEIRERRS